MPVTENSLKLGVKDGDDDGNVFFTHYSCLRRHVIKPVHAEVFMEPPPKKSARETLVML